MQESLCRRAHRKAQRNPRDPRRAQEIQAGNLGKPRRGQESTGEHRRAWHPDFVSWSKRLIAQVVDAGSASGVGSAANSCKAALWRFACSLSVALQRGNFAMMLPSFGSALEPGAALDRLGNPLSEEPQFWRCAPFSALSWVTEAL